jgi:hypothetical protein
MNALMFSTRFTKEEAETVYLNARKDFLKIKNAYSGPFSRVNRLMDKDLRKLMEILSILRYLSFEEVIVDEKSRRVDMSSINKLNWEIMNFLSRFKNTGIIKI